MSKKSNRISKMFRLPPTLAEKLENESKRKGMTKTKIVEWALCQYLGLKQP